MAIAAEKKQVIPDELIREIQAVVGPEWVTTDPVLCQAYNARGYSREQMYFLGYSTRPACVVLPAATSEVVRIVKVCNRFKIPFVPASTMWVIQASPRFREDFVVIDLKRMNKMQIDEKNMIAILEPGVVYGQLLEEVMRRDLYTIAPGGGSQVSVIANHLNCGMCPLCYRIPLSDRRMNAAEWVSPEGDVVIMGSRVAGENAWFWQDGLGPGALGILRGQIGWNGGLGIVTRMSVKLYPFQPQRMLPEGRTPETHSVLPPRMKFFNFSMPNAEALAKSMDELSKAQIAAAVTKVPVSWRVIAKAQDRNEFWDEWAKMTEEEISKTHILRILLIGYTSQKQLEYEEKVLMDIVVNELGGIYRRTKQTDQSLLKMSDSAGMWMMTGGYMSNTAGVDSLRICEETGKLLGKEMLEYAPPLMPEYNDPGWFQSAEFGHQYYLEVPAYMDPDTIFPGTPKFSPSKVTKTYRWYMSAVPKIEVETGFYSIFDGQHTPVRLKGPAWHNYQVWCDRFKAEFDPNGISNPPQPYDIDEIAARHPEFVTQEAKDAVDKVAKK
jgi:hypothetical protein